jgi:HK97 family phage portal protein
MAVDLFGIAKRRELLKAALKREIERELQPSSRSYLQDWDTRQEKEGRTPKISYRHLEAVYRRESWVRACTDVIQRTATSNGYRLIGKETLELVDPRSKEFSPIISLLARPNADDTLEEILAEIVVDLHLYGDAYVEIVRDTQGNPVALYNIYAPSIRVLVDEHGTVKGYVQKPMGMLSGSSQAVTFKANEIAHFRLPNPGNEVYGLSPLESLEIVIETDLYAQDYNRNFFKNHAVPRLHVDLGNCTLPQLKRIREYFAHEIQGTENAHKTIVTEGGAKITPIGTKPNDMEFLNQRKFSRDEICSVYGIPPMKLGVFEDVNRASSMEADKSFKSEKIIPLQRMLAKKINSCIISTFNKVGDKVLFEFVEVDLRDAKEQAEIDKLEIDSGVLTVDEVRRKKGLGPKNKKSNT